MKNLTNIFLAFCLLSFLTFSNVEAQNSRIDQLFGNSHFLFEQFDDAIVVSMEKAPWEAFTFSLDNEDFFNNPICKVQVKSVDDIVLRVDLSDGNTIFEGIGGFSRKITGNGEYQELEFDFSSAISNFEVTSKPYLIIYVNPGQEYTGEIMVKNLNFTVYNDNAQAPELTNILPELIVYPNPVVDVVNVELPESFNGKIIVRDVSGREVYDSYIDDSFSSIAQADLSYLTTGTYFVSLVGQDYALSSRIQIN